MNLLPDFLGSEDCPVGLSKIGWHYHIFSIKETRATGTDCLEYCLQRPDKVGLCRLRGGRNENKFSPKPVLEQETREWLWEQTRTMSLMPCVYSTFRKPPLVQRRCARCTHAGEHVRSPMCPLYQFFAFVFCFPVRLARKCKRNDLCADFYSTPSHIRLYTVWIFGSASSPLV